jgi:RNA polymerase sigma-70 factor (ECF subfamily)
VKGGFDMKDVSIDINDNIDEVMTLYSNTVYRLALVQTKNKVDAEDVFQEVFLRYVRSKTHFQSEEHRKAWFIRVTVNFCKKLWASSWLRKTEPLDETITFEMQEETDLHHELLKLPMKYRTVIHLFYFEDMSIEEISKCLNQGSSTIRTQLTRARYKLKEYLKEDYDV